jgi:Zn-dependent M32 family carboxypeptidase
VSKTYEELKSRLASIHDLHMARSILGWDQHTKMPPRGGEVRA